MKVVTKFSVFSTPTSSEAPASVPQCLCSSVTEITRVVVAHQPPRRSLRVSPPTAEIANARRVNNAVIDVSGF